MDLLSHYYIFVIITITTRHTLIYDQLKFYSGNVLHLCLWSCRFGLLTYPSSKSLQSDISTSFSAFLFHTCWFPSQFGLLSHCALQYFSHLYIQAPRHTYGLFSCLAETAFVFCSEIFIFLWFLCLFRKVNFFKAMKILWPPQKTAVI